LSLVLPDPGPPNEEFARPASRERLEGIDAEAHSGLSETLRELGLTAEFEELGRCDSIRTRLKAMDRETQDREMRKLGAYAYAAGNVILVAGHQKLVRDIPEGLRRIREYSLPREFARMQAIGYPGTIHGKTLILHTEPGNRIRVIFVPETLGF